MKKYLALIILSFFYTTAVHSELYIGVKGGEMKISNDIPFNDATSIGILFGGTIQDSGFAIEGEITTTVSSAEHESRNDELDIFTFAGYGVYRSSGKLYFKGKAGLLTEYLNISGGRFALEGYGGAISLGAGAGFRISNNTNLEFEYTIIETDIDFVSLGITFDF